MGGPEGHSKCHTDKEYPGESWISLVMTVLCRSRLMIGEANIELGFLIARLYPQTAKVHWWHSNPQKQGSCNYCNEARWP